MSSTALFKNADTALLSKKDSYLKYNTLSSDHKSGVDELSGVVKSGLRRKVKETHNDTQLIELKTTEHKNGDNGNSNSGYKSNTVLLSEDILPNDTLQSFSLRYGCSVNDIKRANGLITEQDFYALKTLKIPVSRYSLLTVPEEKQRHRQIYDQFYSQDIASGSTATLISTSIDSELKHSFETILPSHADNSAKSSRNTSPEMQSSSEFDSSESIEETSALLVPSDRPKRASAADKNDTNSYLKKLDKDIRKTVKKADIGKDKTVHNESLNEVLSSIQFYPSEQTMPPPNRVKQTNGADCGMKWWAVILCFFVFLLIIIILAVFEYYRSK